MLSLTTAGDGTWIEETDLGRTWFARWQSTTPSIKAAERSAGKDTFNLLSIICRVHMISLLINSKMWFMSPDILHLLFTWSAIFSWFFFWFIFKFWIRCTFRTTQNLHFLNFLSTASHAAVSPSPVCRWSSDEQETHQDQRACRLHSSFEPWLCLVSWATSHYCPCLHTYSHVGCWAGKYSGGLHWDMGWPYYYCLWMVY